MTEHKYTPGEWGYDKRCGDVYGRPGWIAHVQHERKGDPEFGDRDADGQLMASAPDLLRACEAALEQLGVLIGVASNEFPSCPEDDRVYEMVKAAIAKATGEAT